MLKEFDEFVDFCFEHGGTLRNHKQFGEMARKLRPQIQAAEQSVQPTLLTLCPECGVEQVVTHLPTCAHYVAQSG